MNEVLQCLATEPVPDLLRLAGLLALPVMLGVAHRRTRREGLRLAEPLAQLPFFDGIPLTDTEPDSPCPPADTGFPAPQPLR
ncbi:MAG: hypothetical protein RI988_878 [Pseudomonadota bacterium]|jgi:hypothetical protein